MATAERLSEKKVNELQEQISRLKGLRNDVSEYQRIRDMPEWQKFVKLKEGFLKAERERIEDALRASHSEEAYSDARRSQGVLDAVDALFSRIERPEEKILKLNNRIKEIEDILEGSKEDVI